MKRPRQSAIAVAAPEVVALPAGDARTIKSSFRYFPDGVKVADEDGNMLLIMIAPQPYHRAVLTDDGRVSDYWGETRQAPIDKFK
jgi:hypothetical protein